MHTVDKTKAKATTKATATVTDRATAKSHLTILSKLPASTIVFTLVPTDSP